MCEMYTTSQDLTTQNEAKLSSSETKVQEPWTNWNTSTSKSGLKDTTKSKRNEFRYFQRLRRLRYSAEMMGPTLPPMRSQAISGKNYVRMYSEDYQRTQQAKIQFGEDDKPRLLKRKKRRSKQRSSKKSGSLLEHPKEKLTSKRCQAANSGTPEVFEIFCDDDEESKTTKEEATVRMLMKPVEIKGSNSLLSDSTDPRANEIEPCAHLREMGQVHQGLSKGSSSFWRLRCVIM
uniref:Uncharacterized protein n=1 Tax=Biomphalaria glabrata TaxID=6526 RepID=A0A2C9LVH3_BIOGL